jgi:MoaA/NifB/PqqE/SkfB family radical SAM enzyme
MKTRHKIEVIKSLAMMKCFKSRIPFAVGIMLTKRCNYKCPYCGFWQRCDEKDLAFEQIKHIIDELTVLGTRFVSFSGGEPLLYEKIEDVLDYCKLKGMFVKLNSNGGLVLSKIGILDKIDLLIMNLDGPEEIHDRIKIKGAYKNVIASAKAALDKGVKVSFGCTLNRFNLKHVEDVLNIALKFNAKVAFQPATRVILGSDKANPISPEEKPYRDTIDLLIGLKTKRNNISNSVGGLLHLRKWPDPTIIKCYAGRFHCGIYNNGDVYPCGRVFSSFKPVNCLQIGVKAAFQKAIAVNLCSDCWCSGEVEMNKIASFDFSAIINAFEVF